MNWTLPILVFFVSVVGSIHCGVMCVPLLHESHSRWRDQRRFHLSRWFGYVMWWLLLRSLSWNSYFDLGLKISKWISLLLILWVGVQALQLLWPQTKLQIKTPKLSFKTVSRHLPEWPLGFTTSLRGCGWMWSFVILAAAEPEWLTSAAILLSFFAGTLVPFLLRSHFFQLTSKWSLKVRGVGLLTLCLMQVVFLFANPLSSLHDLQSLILGPIKGMPPTLCGKPSTAPASSFDKPKADR